MKIEKCIEFKASIEEIKDLITAYNRDIYQGNKKDIDKILQENIVSENPKNVLIRLEELESPFFLYVDLKNIQDLKNLVENNIMAIMPSKYIEIMQNAKSVILSIYEDKEYTKEFCICNLNGAIY
jgi:hypothetical protein